MNWHVVHREVRLGDGFSSRLDGVVCEQNLGGAVAGESDQWGYKPLDRSHPTTVYDIHATVLHLLGIDHTRLTFRSNGVDRRLTDVHGEVIQGLLA
jgi:hypothetical protein